MVDVSEWPTNIHISIHALREEGDVVDVSEWPTNIHISIHALREEGDGKR